LMNSLPKVVFSKTLHHVDWENSRLVREDFIREVTRMKNEPGRDIAIFGSSELAVTFVQQGLIDEFRIMINPVVLGGGKPLFYGIHPKLSLTLIKTRTFKSGNILLYYEPAKTP